MKTKDKQRQLLIELMNTDHDSGLYDLSREDVEQIIRTCGNPKKIKSMDKREIKKCVYKILDAFCNRAGFDHWWYDLGEVVEQEIIKELEGIISKRINNTKEIEYFKSEEAQQLFQEMVEHDTWGKGLPKIYMDKKGNIVEHWKDGTINIIKHKDMTKEQAKDELIEVLMNQVTDLTMMSKIELGDDVIAEIVRLKELLNDNN